MSTPHHSKRHLHYALQSHCATELKGNRGLEYEVPLDLEPVGLVRGGARGPGSEA